MKSNADAWEADYLLRGPLWGGSVQHLPDLVPGSRVLELGCGNGKSLACMAGRGWDVTAIDFSPRAAGLCRHISSRNSPPHLIIADARDCPFRDASFDCIFATHIIGHLPAPDRQRTAAEIRRLLVADGNLLFVEFSTEDLRSATGIEIEPGTYRRGNGIITHYFSVEDAVSLFSLFRAISVTTHQWSMRIRGKDLKRSEIHAVFAKQC